MKFGNADQTTPRTVGRPEDFTGEETSIVFSEPLGRYYIVVNKQLIEYDPVTYRRRLVYDGVTAVSIDPEGSVVFASQVDDEKSQVRLLLLIPSYSRIVHFRTNISEVAMWLSR